MNFRKTRYKYQENKTKLELIKHLGRFTIKTNSIPFNNKEKVFQSLVFGFQFRTMKKKLEWLWFATICILYIII